MIKQPFPLVFLYLQDTKAHSRISASDASRSGESINVGSDSNPGLFGNSRAAAQLSLRTKNGENVQNSAGHGGADSGAKTVATRVFAPSSHFANTLPRFSAANPAEVSSSSRSLSKDASNKPNAAGEPQKGADRSQAGGPTHRSVGTITTTAEVGVNTEIDSLGPCEPGTTVHLEGIVWHETDTGARTT